MKRLKFLKDTLQMAFVVSFYVDVMKIDGMVYIDAIQKLVFYLKIRVVSWKVQNIILLNFFVIS